MSLRLTFRFADLNPYADVMHPPHRFASFGGVTGLSALLYYLKFLNHRVL